MNLKELRKLVKAGESDRSWPSRPQTAGVVAGAVTGEDAGEDDEEVAEKIR